LLKNYGNERSPERRLIETNEIHILPNMNPDGYSKSIPGKCDGAVGK
jgi:murein tripeptide amidase MpaA